MQPNQPTPNHLAHYTPGTSSRIARTLLAICLFTLTLVACSAPDFPDLPGLPSELSEIPDVLRNLELPDLSSIGIELPDIATLPALQAPQGGILFTGPTERQIKTGERVPGTDVTLISARDGLATFQILGMQSPRRIGDSVDFDGAWPMLPGSVYQARLRIYAIGNGSLRLAGVHQLMIPNIQPVMNASPSAAFTLRFPFTDGVTTGNGSPPSDVIAGTTLGYLGQFDRGAQLTGLGDNIFPYRSTGDSIEWQGALRPDVGIAYDLRVLNYGRDGLRVGGTATLTLPGP